MKNNSYKNIITVFLVTLLFLSNANSIVYCTTEDNCQVECCEETENAVDHNLKYSSEKENCCEIFQIVANELKTSPASNIYSKNIPFLNISSNILLSPFNQRKSQFQKPAIDFDLRNKSITILRI